MPLNYLVLRTSELCWMGECCVLHTNSRSTWLTSTKPMAILSGLGHSLGQLVQSSLLATGVKPLLFCIKRLDSHLLPGSGRLLWPVQHLYCLPMGWWPVKGFWWEAHRRLIAFLFWHCLVQKPLDSHLFPCSGVLTAWLWWCDGQWQVLDRWLMSTSTSSVTDSCCAATSKLLWVALDEAKTLHNLQECTFEPQSHKAKLLVDEWGQ